MHRSPILNLVTISISCVGSLLTQITCYLKITSLLSTKKKPPYFGTRYSFLLGEFLFILQDPVGGSSLRLPRLPVGLTDCSLLWACPKLPLDTLLLCSIILTALKHVRGFCT